MKKYRKIKKTDKLPALPESIEPIWILIGKHRTYIFGYDEKSNYTFTWNGVDKFPEKVEWQAKGLPLEIVDITYEKANF